MQGYIRRLENPPVSSREAFAELDARKAAEAAEAEVVHEPSAAERVAEHTGHDEYWLADQVADALAASGRAIQLTSGERLLVAQVLRNHR